MSLEKLSERPTPQPTVSVAQTHIEIQGLIPEKEYPPIVNNSTGEIMRKGYINDNNLKEKTKELREAIETRPWLRDFWRDIRTGRKSAIVSVVLGGLVITTAIGAEFEFGIRHGKDIREIRKLLKKKPHK